jgi:hypothetical protein
VKGSNKATNDLGQVSPGQSSLAPERKVVEGQWLTTRESELVFGAGCETPADGSALKTLIRNFDTFQLSKLSHSFRMHLECARFSKKLNNRRLLQCF